MPANRFSRISVATTYVASSYASDPLALAIAIDEAIDHGKFLC